MLRVQTNELKELKERCLDLPAALVKPLGPVFGSFRWSQVSAMMRDLLPGKQKVLGRSQIIRMAVLRLGKKLK